MKRTRKNKTFPFFFSKSGRGCRGSRQKVERKDHPVIVHGFSTVRNDDKIIVLKHGTIVEQSTHDEFRGQNGKNLYLYDLQIGLRD